MPPIASLRRPWVKDVGFLKLLAFFKNGFNRCKKRKTMLKNDIKNIGPCGCFFARVVQKYEIWRNLTIMAF